jgi:hypothetical protein
MIEARGLQFAPGDLRLEPIAFPTTEGNDRDADAPQVIAEPTEGLLEDGLKHFFDETRGRGWLGRFSRQKEKCQTTAQMLARPIAPSEQRGASGGD